MRVTAETHRAHGAAILRAAASLFRGRGIEAVSVAEITSAAGLTHGAFYGHFASKAALAQAACRDTLQASAERWRAIAEAARAMPGAMAGDGLAALIDRYLTERHRDAPQAGCVLAALAPEITRGEPALRDVLADGTAGLLDVIEEELALLRPAADPTAWRDTALGVLAAMAGGIIVARALTDPARSTAALAAAARTARAAADL